MEKRLNRTDLGFSLAFLFMLVIATGAFFYGVKVGTDRVQAERLEAERSSKPLAQSAPNAYQQQDLVSFYHTVFLPYREFQNEWFSARGEWNADPSADLSASLKMLSKTANAKYAKIKSAFVSPSSPLLKDAQTDYMKSLKLFSDSFANLASTANKGTTEQLLQSLENQAFYTEGRKYALSGQNAYYTAMLKWAATVNPDIPEDFKSPAVIELARWKSMPLIIKNKVAVDYLSSHSLYADFLPHDLTARIDQFIRSGQADKMKQTTVGSIAELLTGTDAVRNGDFLGSKTMLYPNEQLPQLPFFIPDK
ncbi:hypothetical protein GE107_11445 [Cohnella sp. CFH 77786]|uniref:hypothetical protein n=1 Tax=Cohnella sp. CFH 77786 TaxID=2662265 RepID=UPI001C60D59E|nr:hypothetical protein [Cohnella sp. CFH 77786]MBW5446675.1 hypothetical protein [Cohnella sp. CFH 77786]